MEKANLGDAADADSDAGRVNTKIIKRINDDKKQRKLPWNYYPLFFTKISLNSSQIYPRIGHTEGNFGSELTVYISRSDSTLKNTRPDLTEIFNYSSFMHKFYRTIFFYSIGDQKLWCRLYKHLFWYKMSCSKYYLIPNMC